MHAVSADVPQWRQWDRRRRSVGRSCREHRRVTRPAGVRYGPRCSVRESPVLPRPAWRPRFAHKCRRRCICRLPARRAAPRSDRDNADPRRHIAARRTGRQWRSDGAGSGRGLRNRSGDTAPASRRTESSLSAASSRRSSIRDRAGSPAQKSHSSPAVIRLSRDSNFRRWSGAGWPRRWASMQAAANFPSATDCTTKL